jgi:Sulfotransferase family
VAEGIDAGPPMELRLFSFSSEKDLPEQVASLRSFLTHVGTPTKFTVISDGSHSAAGRQLLRAVHPCIDVIDWDRFARRALPTRLADFAAASWRGKKVAAVLSFPVDEPVLYADSDILFFPPARELRELSRETGPRYLRDCGERRFLDDRLLRDEREGEMSVNSGFFFHAHALDWAPALERLEQVTDPPRTFTGQTIVHLTMHHCGAQPFDRSRYVVADDDRALPEDAHVHADTALRHYVTPVRHKFWTTLSGSPASTAQPVPRGGPPPAARAPELVVTGISRSGTSYLCNLLHRFENCVAINEPSEMIGLLRREDLPWGVPDFYQSVRRDVLAGKPIENKLLDGEVVEDTTKSQARRRYKPGVAGDDFVLAVKNTREFLLRLEDVRRVMPAARIVACVRDPFDTIASWKASFPHLHDADVAPFIRHEGQMWLSERERGTLREIPATPDPAERRARWWTFQARRVLHNRDALVLVRYDDLVHQPMTVLDQVLDGFRSGGLRRPISPSTPRGGRELLDEHDHEAIRTICSPVAAELGL